MVIYQDAETLDGVADQKDMDQYCYYVAGVVGEMLTELFCDHSPEIDAHRDEMMKLGFKLVTNGTDNHLILADVYTSFGIDGKIAEEALDKVGFSLNKNSIPDDPLPPFKPSGIRLGTPALTTRGMKEDDMALIAKWMKQAIDARNDEKKLKKIRNETREFCLQSLTIDSSSPSQPMDSR